MIAPDVERRKAPLIADERSMLEGWLDYHHATLLMKCAGLSEEQLKRRSVWIYLHMIEEYARHNGHADLLRERIDGVTGD